MLIFKENLILAQASLRQGRAKPAEAGSSKFQVPSSKFQVPSFKEQPRLERAGRGSSAGSLVGAESTGCTRGYIPAPPMGRKAEILKR